MEALSDFELVRKTNEGHIEAFSVLVLRYQKPLQSLSMRYVHDINIAEDVVQDSFLKAFEKLAGFQFRSDFKIWIYRIVINTSKNSLRSKRPIVDIEKVSLQSDSECEKALIDKQLLLEAKKIIKNLPEKQQLALKKRVFEDKSFKQVAKDMDCPYDTAKANYRHGLIKLQEKMVITW